MDKAFLIREYEAWRRLLDELNAQTDLVDERPVEIERLLLNDYQYPGDPPC